MFFSISREGVTYRLAGYLSAGVSTHTIADNEQSPLIWNLYNIEAIIVIHARPFF